MIRRAVGVVIILWLAVVAVVAAAGLLDGRTFVGELGEKGKDKGEAETLVFKDGLFDPLQCHQWGFGAVPYKARIDRSLVHFEAETKSEKEGTMHWRGTVEEGAISATALWTKEGQAPIEYSFKGTLKP
jgi:hypothetical protein